MKGMDLKSGFTLLEMLVVIAIAALVLSTSMYGVSMLGKERPPSVFADEMTALLNDARQAAITRGRAQEVEFDLGKKIIRGVDHMRMNIPKGLSVTVTVGFEVQAAGVNPRVFFLEDGTSSGAAIEVVSHAGRAVVETNWLTGLSVRR